MTGVQTCALPIFKSRGFTCSKISQHPPHGSVRQALVNRAARGETTEAQRGAVTGSRSHRPRAAELADALVSFRLPLPTCSLVFLLLAARAPPRALGRWGRGWGPLVPPEAGLHLSPLSRPRLTPGESWEVLGLSPSLLQGLELCRVVAVHVENLLSAREKRLTLPPSEITLL